ncbi:MAG: hypothetical protein WAN32_21365, partial [Candidatus Acidiferrum sp.]
NHSANCSFGRFSLAVGVFPSSILGSLDSNRLFNMGHIQMFFIRDSTHRTRDWHDGFNEETKQNRSHAQ